MTSARVERGAMWMPSNMHHGLAHAKHRRDASVGVRGKLWKAVGTDPMRHCPAHSLRGKLVRVTPVNIQRSEYAVAKAQPDV